MTTAAATPLLERISPEGQRLSDAEIGRAVTEHLDELGLDGADVVVLIPDATRSGPMPQLFGLVARALSGRARRVRFVVALGTHQPMDDAALDRLVGADAGERERLGVELLNHRWEDPETYAALGELDAQHVARLSQGRLSRAVPVRLNRALVEADHVLICGPVFPHEVVGFSGGTKYVVPGVAGQELIDLSHWLGALITSAEIIGTLGTTPVRALIDAAADLVPTPITGLCFVVEPGSTALRGIAAGEVREAWAAAARLSAQVHVRYVDSPFRTVLSVVPPRYDEMWTAAKAMYKVEPVVADGGEVIIYAPHITRFSVTHDEHLRQVGYHCRDWFLTRWDDVRDLPWGVLAHSTHLYGAGTYDPSTGEETPRVRVTLATGIGPEECAAMNLGYRDPSTLDVEEFAGREQDGVLLVREAGEQLYRLRENA